MLRVVAGVDKEGSVVVAIIAAALGATAVVVDVGNKKDLLALVVKVLIGDEVAFISSRSKS